VNAAPSYASKPCASRMSTFFMTGVYHTVPGRPTGGKQEGHIRTGGIFGRCFLAGAGEGFPRIHPDWRQPHAMEIFCSTA